MVSNYLILACLVLLVAMLAAYVQYRHEERQAQEDARELMRQEISQRLALWDMIDANREMRESRGLDDV